MATWMTHFRVADKFIDIIGKDKLDLPCFIFGNIAPDCGIPNDDNLTYTPDKDISHFGHTSNRDYAAFRENYLEDKSDKESFSFYLGYYLHLLTDAEWVCKIARPAEKQFKDSFTDKSSFICAIKTDWYDLDKLYLKKNPQMRAFSIFSGMKSFANIYFNFFPSTAFDWQLNRIRSFYLAPAGNLNREYKYLTEAELDGFMNESLIDMTEEMVRVV
ncbi:MAG: zinc dependent phospholipase C family protein [Oscillospiraceae bacterium]|nr:zinc dependent phospholipase C family protein [Oscillospiraceae bacterium]